MPEDDRCKYIYERGHFVFKVIFSTREGMLKEQVKKQQNNDTFNKYVTEITNNNLQN